MSQKKNRFQTKAIRTQFDKTHADEHSVPMYLTSSYVFDDAEQMRALFAEEQSGYVYSRYSNPNVDEFIAKVAFLEGTETGWATASGMAALFTTFGSLLQAGDHIVSSRTIYGGTYAFLKNFTPRMNIQTSFVDITKLEVVEAAI